MSEISKALLDEFKSLEKRINNELTKKQNELHYKIEKRKIKFEKEQLIKFKKIKKSILAYLFESSFLTAITIPFIYFMIFPALFFDISAWCYQQICFPIYQIPKVKRNEYIILDRHHLKYLNLIERFNCVYCGYVNGVINYIREIASRSEQYWCPIRHALKARGVHQRHFHFLHYGDSENYHIKLQSLREKIRELH